MFDCSMETKNAGKCRTCGKETRLLDYCYEAYFCSKECRDVLDKELEPYFNQEVEVIVDDIGGVHDEGLGWNPHGIFCGECSNMTCIGCVNKDATE